MARELRRLLMAPERLGTPALTLTPAEHHYLARVLRYRPGDRFAVVDGCGHLWSARLGAGSSAELEQPPDQPLQRQSAPRGSLLLAAALPRREAEAVIRMATELGIDQLQPLVADHSSLRPPLPLSRWRTIIQEAAEQCERLWLPQLTEPVAAGPWLGQGRPEGPALLATTRRSGLPLLGEWLAGFGVRSDPPAGAARPPSGISLRLAIGPEGGWSSEEEERALASGWQAVSLGPTILRASTAAMAAVALLSDWRQRR